MTDKYKVIRRDGVDYITTEIVVHKFDIIADDDSIIVAGEPLHQWEQSPAGQWIKQHAIEKPRWVTHRSMDTWRDHFAILAWLTEQDITYFKLKFA